MLCDYKQYCCIIWFWWRFSRLLKFLQFRFERNSSRASCTFPKETKGLSITVEHFSNTLYASGGEFAENKSVKLFFWIIKNDCEYQRKIIIYLYVTLLKLKDIWDIYKQQNIWKYYFYEFTLILFIFLLWLTSLKFFPFTFYQIVLIVFVN